jgi:hypothetical protein
VEFTVEVFGIRLGVMGKSWVLLTWISDSVASDGLECFGVAGESQLSIDGFKFVSNVKGKYVTAIMNKAIIKTSLLF